MNITWPTKVDGDLVTASDMNQIRSSLNPNQISFNENIPFTRPITILAPHTVVADLVLVPVTSGAVPGNGAMLEIEAKSSYTVDLSAFELGKGTWVNDDATVNQLVFVYTGSRYLVYISQPSSIAAPVPNTAPVASSVAFTGTQTQGQILTGTYSYSDADSDAQGATIKKWYRADNNSGLNEAAISGATNSTYTLQAGDVGKYIRFGVTPKAATGITTGTEVFSSYSGAIIAGGFVSLDFTGSTGMESAGGSDWRANATNNVYGNLGKAGVKIPAGQDGRIFTTLNGTSNGVNFGLYTSNTEVGYASMVAGMALQASGLNAYRIDSGVASLVYGGLASGNLISVFRNGTTGVHKMQVSTDNGVSWGSDIAMSYNNTGDEWVVADSYGKGSLSAGLLINPRAEGVV